jgi:RHS repeat-associated protein
MKQLLHIAVFLLSTVSVFAHIGTYTTILKGVNVAQNRVLLNQDDRYTYMLANAGWTTEFMYAGAPKNRISLKYDGSERKVYTQAWWIEVSFSLQKWNNAGGALTTETGTLRITYDPAAQTTFTDLQAYETSGGYKTRLIITGISKSSNLIFMPKDVSLESEIIVERYYLLDPAQTAFLAHVLNTTDNTIEFHWDFIPGAEEYDLEWLFVSYYEQNTANFPSSITSGLFKNATRVTTSNQYYRIGNIFDKGTIYYRLRAVGIKPGNITLRFEGNWMGSTTTNKFTVLNTDDYKNWQYSSAFAEDGKLKEVATYFDGTGRQRQAVTLLNTENNAMIAEPIYDYEGRAAIQTLPAPDQNAPTTLKFHEQFSLNSSGNLYSKKDFDTDNLYDSNCDLGASPSFKNTAGAGNYYSDASYLSGDIFHSYVSDALGYPFTQTVFDSEGNVARQSMAGPSHKISGGHEIKHYNATPTQTKLDMLFGNEVGFYEQYKENVVVDANGQQSISYQDLSGNVIATAMSGSGPSAMDNLSGSQSLASTTEGFLSGFDGDGCYTVTHDFFVSNPGTSGAPNPYNFTYTITEESYNALCVSLTKNCVYDLTINIYDECNTLLTSPSYSVTSGIMPIGGGITNLIGQPMVLDATAFGGGPISFSFPVTFPKIGTYYIEKKLCLNEQAMETALADFQQEILTNPEQTCIQPLSDISDVYQQELLSSDCYPGGSECETNCQESATSSGLIPQSAEWFDYVNQCMTEVCEISPVDASAFDCSELYDLLKSDMSPGGQYFDDIKYTASYAALTPSSTFYDNIISQINTAFGSSTFENDFQYYCTTINTSCPAPPGGDYSWQNVRDNWQDCYGDYLVKYHPEYCRYLRCQQLSSSSYFDFQLSSHDYAWATNGTNHFDDNGWTDMLAADPLASHPTYGSSFTSALTTYITGSPVLWTRAQTMANTACSCTASNEQVWQMLRALYLKTKKTFEIGNIGCTEICGFGTSALPDNMQDPQGPHVTGCSVYNWSGTIYISGTPTTYTLTQLTEGDGFIIRDPDPTDDLILINENNYANTTQVIENQYDICHSPAFVDLNVCQEAPDAPACSTLTLNAYIPGTGLISLIGSTTSAVISSATCGTNDDIHCSLFAQDVAAAVNNWHPTTSDPDFTAVIDPAHSGTVRLYAPTILGNIPNNSYYIVSEGFKINESPFVPGSGTPESTSYLDGGATNDCDPFPGTPTCFCQTLKSIQDAYMMEDDNGDPVIEQSNGNYTNLNEYTAYTLNQSLISLGSTYTISVTQVEDWRENCELGNTLPQSNAYLSGNHNPTNDPALVVPSQLDCDYTPPCLGDAPDIGDYYAGQEQLAQLQAASENFLEEYKAECFKGVSQGGTFSEAFTVEYNDKQYQFTLYFYDQANNLTRTVPPRAVTVLTGTVLATVQNHRLDPGSYIAVYPNTNRSNNALVTNYKYNTLNGVKESESPDGGLTQFWYDKTGRLRFSQNAKQFAVKAATCGGSCPNGYEGNYSYTLYDAQSRIIEVGETDEYYFDDPSHYAPFYMSVDDQSFPSNPGKQVTKTYYDNELSSNPVNSQFTTAGPENLRKRVVATTFEETEDYDDNTYQTATHYSYDIHGNVSELIQENTELSSLFITQAYKKIDYTYDLISGKVNTVSYQPGYRDKFYYKYDYDADNRLTHALSSPDNVIWEEDQRNFYYLHGPLARTEIGGDKVQGMDYAYTINGWIKTVNANTLDKYKDMGNDGINDYVTGGGTTGIYQDNNRSIHSNVAADAFGYSLGYFDGDYEAVDNSVNNPLTTNNTHNFLFDISTLSTGTADLFNGNIKEMATAMYKPNAGTQPSQMPFMVNKYKYDQLNRLLEMNSLFYTNSGFASASNPDDDYYEHYTYDADGNIITLLRKAYTGGGHNNSMDNFSYIYPGSNNMVQNVFDTGNNSTASFGDYPGAATGLIAPNYSYDEIGNLDGDRSEQIVLNGGIKWSVYGKILEINRTSSSTKPDLEFKYGPDGNRVAKIVKPKNGSGALLSQGDWIYTYYVRDAAGNVMATYERTGATTENETFVNSDHTMYGSSRLGVQQSGANMFSTLPVSKYHDRLRGSKTYEGSNHLGNVLVTFSDIKLSVPNGTTPSAVDYYLADVRSATDYYPFGMSMPGRKFNPTDYRYGFNGKENDGSVESASSAGEGTQDYGMRIYNPAIGKFLSVDPLAKKYPELTPYQFSSNNPIENIDIDGLEGVSTTTPMIPEAPMEELDLEHMRDMPGRHPQPYGKPIEEDYKEVWENGGPVYYYGRPWIEFTSNGGFVGIFQNKSKPAPKLQPPKPFILGQPALIYDPVGVWIVYRISYNEYSFKTGAIIKSDFTYKFGISGQDWNTNGTHPRPETQVSKLNRDVEQAMSDPSYSYDSYRIYKSTIITKDCNKLTAEFIEQQKVNGFYSLYGEPPEGNKKPLPDPMRGFTRKKFDPLYNVFGKKKF